MVTVRASFVIKTQNANEKIAELLVKMKGSQLVSWHFFNVPWDSKLYNQQLNLTCKQKNDPNYVNKRVGVHNKIQQQQQQKYADALMITWRNSRRNEKQKKMACILPSLGIKLPYTRTGEFLIPPPGILRVPEYYLFPLAHITHLLLADWQNIHDTTFLLLGCS